MSSVDYDYFARRIKLMAHPVRLRILDTLRRHAECVCHLEVLLERPQPYISQQVRVLHQAGVVQAEKQGLNTFYRVTDEEMLSWLDLILGPQPKQMPGDTGHQVVSGCPCPICSTTLHAKTQELASIGEA